LNNRDSLLFLRRRKGCEIKRDIRRLRCEKFDGKGEKFHKKGEDG